MAGQGRLSEAFGKRFIGLRHIDEMESGICPALSSGLMSDIKAKSFQNPAAASCGVLCFSA